MKKILLLLTFLSVLLSGYFFYKTPIQDYIHNVIYYSYCSEPIAYRIDTVDPKFNLSKDKFIQAASQAAKIWDSAYGKTLFVYDPKGELSVNLIYDERQKLTSEINQLESTVKSQQKNLKPQIEQYEKASAQFKQKINQLNQEIQEWNLKGGAPADEYNQLTQRQAELQQEASRLNETAQNLNLTTNEYNTQVSELNQTIDTFGQVLQLRPEEGIFKGPENTIEVYFYIDQPELVHTLSHEFGHSLGIDHNNNIQSLMYPKTTKALTLSSEDKQALFEICKERSKLELIQQRLQQLVKNLQ